MQKQERQAILEKIVQEHPTQTQEELQAYLRHFGIDTTQATLSRDLRELKITKMRDEFGKARYLKLAHQNQGNAQQRVRSALKMVTKAVETVDFVVIIKTTASYGNFLAAALDDLDTIATQDVVGTVAGHDTVAVFCTDQQAATQLATHLRHYL